MGRLSEATLSKMFAVHRRHGRSGQRYGEEAKVLAQEARQQGLSVAVIAKAAGGCDKTVYGWLAKRQLPQLKQLALIDEPVVMPQQRLIIHLPSGLKIEVA